jgi:anaphase-promoting complex subunit 4
MEDPVKLSLLSEKTLHQPADPRLLAYCPSMDLVAFASTDQQVWIYRLNGQRVYGASQKGSALTVESVRWKPNGQSNLKSTSLNPNTFHRSATCDCME